MASKGLLRRATTWFIRGSCTWRTRIEEKTNGTYHSLTTSSRPSLGAKIKAKSHGYRIDSQLLNEGRNGMGNREERKREREKDRDNENGTATGEAKAPLSHSSSSVKTKKIKAQTIPSKSNVFVAVGIRSPNEALRTIQGYSTNSAAAGGIIAGSRSKSAEHP
eukprot:scaffold3445_cov80-Skeletonema_marinoi.AAC.20